MPRHLCLLLISTQCTHPQQYGRKPFNEVNVQLIAFGAVHTEQIYRRRQWAHLIHGTDSPTYR